MIEKLIDDLSKFDLTKWTTWVALVVGLVISAYVFHLSRVLLGRLYLAMMGKYTGPERRVSARREGDPVAVLVTDSTNSAEPHQGMVLDRSMTGLCMSMDKSFEVGWLLKVRPSDAPQETPWVEVEVRNCRHGQGKYKVGCKFITQPPWTVLRLFG